MAVFSVWICGLSCDSSFVVMDAAMTGRDTPQARPNATLDGTNTYGTFCEHTGIQDTRSEPVVTQMQIQNIGGAEVLAAYREKAKTAHPDQGGTRVQWDALVAAKDNALAIVQGRAR